MNYITYGNKKNKSLLFIHGLASTAKLCFEPLLPYLQDYYIVLCELDGHCASKPDDMLSLKDSIDDIENYMQEEMNGKVYGLCGFSMGATMAVELIARGNISVEKVLLDAAIVIEMGLMALPFQWAFMIGTSRIRHGKPIPRFLLNKMMGKDNHSVIEMMYTHIRKKTIQNACQYLYHYKIPENLKKFSNPVLFWRGSEEPIPAKGEKKLKEYLPQMASEIFENMGLVCLFATLMIMDFILVIPKFGSKHFGAPDDIKEMMEKMPDRAPWVNLLGICIMIAGFVGVTLVLIWAMVDTVKTELSFIEAFIRFFIITEGYKLFDIICFDYLMLTKLKLPERIYPETAGAKGYDNFGFNAKSQITKLIVFCGISLLLAFILTVIIPLWR